MLSPLRIHSRRDQHAVLVEELRIREQHCEIELAERVGNGLTGRSVFVMMDTIPVRQRQMLKRLLSGLPWLLVTIAILLVLPGANATGDELPSVTYGRDCPDVLIREEGEALSCVLVDEGTLVSKIGNLRVVYRLYSWFHIKFASWTMVPGEDHAQKVASGSRLALPNAVTLALADRSDRVFWWLRYDMFTGRIDNPRLVQNPEHGEFLVVDSATGKYGWRQHFLGRETWVLVQEPYYDLERYLPMGYRFRRPLATYVLDYSTLESTMDVYRPSDAECCPSGGELWYRLRLEEDSSNDASFRFAIDAARYIPPQSEQK